MGRRRLEPVYNPPITRGIIAILLVVLAIIITLSFFNKAGVVGEILNNYVLSFLFGSMRFITPVMIIILAWFLIKDTEYDYRSTHGIGSLLFFLASSSLMHLGFATSEMWNKVLMMGQGGGIFGMLAWPLKTYLGNVASIVLLIGIILISVFLIFNTAFIHFVQLNKKLFSGLGFLGKSLLGLTGLFVKENQPTLNLKNNYNKEEEEEEEEYEDEENDEEVNLDQEEDIGSRKFQTKKVKTETDDEEEDDSEDDDDPSANAQGKSKIPSAWDKKIIVKDLPELNLLTTKKSKPTSGDIEANAATIKNTLHEFGIDVDMGEVRVGPTVTQYSFKPAKGVKLTRITTLSNDLSLALAAHPIRIEAPIPGQSLVGIEVPNTKVAMVTIKELIESEEFKHRPHNMMIALGKDVAGKVWFADLPKMPHLLVAGATGSGKTVCINTIIMSLLYQNTAETLRMIMVDPKRVELTLYNGIPHLLTPVITNVQKTVNALKWTIGEMDRRFDVLAAHGCRDIGSYNTRYPKEKMPNIVFIIDELADLMAAAASEVEAGIIRLAQMSRAIGIHLVVATQRPSVDIITGLMKANIPARIAFSVASIMDSRTILDCPGADKLLGRGDMLYLTAELSKPKRIQGAFISEEEVGNVVEYLKEDGEAEYDSSIIEKPTSGTVNMFGGASDDQDPLFNEAREEIIKAGKASASFLQRRFKVGYARAARILDELEAAGVIGPGEGAKAREILATAVPETMNAGGELNVFDSVEKEIEEEEEIDDEESSSAKASDDTDVEEESEEEKTEEENTVEKY